MNAMQPPMAMVMSQHSDGPTFVHKASACLVLIAASVGFVAMAIWPVVTRLT